MICGYLFNPLHLCAILLNIFYLLLQNEAKISVHIISILRHNTIIEATGQRVSSTE
jgi:hypothetical protein